MHEIDMSNGRANMAYIGETPWHTLGTEMQPGQSIEDWMRASGLDFEVKLGRVFMQGHDEVVEAKEFKIAYRSDTGKRFVVVSNIYKPMQPRQVFDIFADTASKFGFTIETAGSLKDGAIVWALARTGKDITIGGNDKLKTFLLASTSYDSSQSRRWGFTSVRVVCKNTMELSYSRDKNAVKQRNVGEVDETEVRRRLGMLDDELHQLETDANALSTKRIEREQLSAKLLDWFGKPADKDEPVSIRNLTTRSAKVINDVTKTIVTAPGQDIETARGTAWGVLNGITRHVDFEARAANPSNRLNSAWFGAGNNLKGRVREELLEMETYSDKAPDPSAFQRLMASPLRPVA